MLTDASEAVQHALAVTLRGCDELLPQEDWLQKLIKAEATGTTATAWRKAHARDGV